MGKVLYKLTVEKDENGETKGTTEANFCLTESIEVLVAMRRSMEEIQKAIIEKIDEYKPEDNKRNN